MVWFGVSICGLIRRLCVVQLVFKNPDFVPYFRAVTPEEELSNLNIGSRPLPPQAGAQLLCSVHAAALC